MKRVRSNFHALHVLKRAEPKIRKALITNCNKVIVNCISESVLYVLNVNIKLSVCKTRKVKKQKTALRKVADRDVSLSCMKGLIVQRVGFLMHLLGGYTDNDRLFGF